MKKGYMLFLLLAVVLLMLAGCQRGKGKAASSLQTMLEDSAEKEGKEEEKNSKEVELEDLWRDGEYTLIETALLSKGRLLLCYEKGSSYQFKTYDISNRKIDSESEVLGLDGGLNGGLNKLKVLPKYFYVFSGYVCYIFDDSCRLVLQMDVSDKIDSAGYGFSVQYWISGDLSKAAYIKTEEDGSEYLYVSNLDGSGEEQIYHMGVAESNNHEAVLAQEALWVDEVYWSLDNTCLGFCGNVIPVGEDTSMECYGYIDLIDKRAEVFPDDETWVSYQGNVMLVADKAGERDAVRKGKVKLFSLETKERQEISTKFPDECDFVCLSMNPKYFAGMHREEKARSLTFTVYKDGEAFALAEYMCSDEQQYTDFTASSNSLALDTDTGQIFLFYYDTPSASYAVTAFSYDVF